jgi:hypothetical protein
MRDLPNESTVHYLLVDDAGILLRGGAEVVDAFLKASGYRGYAPVTDVAAPVFKGELRLFRQVSLYQRPGHRRKLVSDEPPPPSTDPTEILA